MLLGEISELFSTPVIPKMVIVGLTGEEDENLQLFKEILTKSLDNLFVIEFCEQVPKRLWDISAVINLLTCDVLVHTGIW